jgi:hypothetical protein
MQCDYDTLVDLLVSLSTTNILQTAEESSSPTANSGQDKVKNAKDERGWGRDGIIPLMLKIADASNLMPKETFLQINALLYLGAILFALSPGDQDDIHGAC